MAQNAVPIEDPFPVVMTIYVNPDGSTIRISKASPGGDDLVVRPGLEVEAICNALYRAVARDVPQGGRDIAADLESTLLGARKALLEAQAAALAPLEAVGTAIRLMEDVSKRLERIEGLFSKHLMTSDDIDRWFKDVVLPHTKQAPAQKGQ